MKKTPTGFLYYQSTSLLKLMYSRVYNFFAKNNLIYQLWFGFRQQYSTFHALVDFTEDIKENLDKGNNGCGIFVDFLSCYLASPQPTLGYYWGYSLTHPVWITAFLHFRPKDYWMSCNEVGPLSLADCLVGFEWGTFWFWLQLLDPLGHVQAL